MHLHWLVHYRYRSTPWGRLQTEIIPVVAGVVAMLLPVLQVNPEVYPSDGGLCHLSNLPCLDTEFFSLQSHWRCLCDSQIYFALSQHSAVPCNQHSSLCKDLLWHTLFIRDWAAIALQCNFWHLYATEFFFSQVASWYRWQVTCTYIPVRNITDMQSYTCISIRTSGYIFSIDGYSAGCEQNQGLFSSRNYVTCLRLRLMFQ